MNPEVKRLQDLIAKKEAVRADAVVKMEGFADAGRMHPDRLIQFKTIEGLEALMRREIAEHRAAIEAFEAKNPIAKLTRRRPETRLDRWLNRGAGGLSKEESAEQSELNAPFGRADGNRYFTTSIFRTIDAPDQAGDGANLTDEKTIAGIVNGLSDYGGLMSLCTVAVTKDGNRLLYPVSDDGNTRGSTRSSLTAEATETALPPFEQRAFEAYPIDSDWCQASRFFDDDLEFSISDFINDTLMRRLGREVEYQITRGTGTDAPQGLLGLAGEVNKTGADETIDWRDIVTLIHSVDPAWLGGERGLYGYKQVPGAVGFLSSWEFIGELRKLRDAQGRPLFLDNLRTMSGMSLMGYPLHVCQTMEHGRFSETGAMPLVFGNFGYFVVRLAGGMMQVEKFYDSATAKTNHDLYLARCRVDSNVITPLVGGKCPAIKGLVRPA